MKKKIFIFLFDGFSDWEIAYLTPEIHKSEHFEVVYFSKDGNPVTSMGGLKITPTMSLTEVNTRNLHLLVLPGGEAWDRGENTEVENLVKSCSEKRKPIAAICAATGFLARLGMLDKIKHTSNDIEYLKMVCPDYKEDSYYINSPAVSDGNLITASGIAPLEFSYEVFKKLSVMKEETLDAWYHLYKTKEAKYFFSLMESLN